MTFATNGAIYQAQVVFKADLEACTNFAGITAYHGALPKPAGNNASHTLAELQALRPYAIVSTPTEGFRAIKDASGDAMVFGGRLDLEITRDTPAGMIDDPAACDADFLKLVGKIIATGDPDNPGLAELSENVGTLPINSIRVLGPARTDERDLAELGDAQRIWLSITWGAQDD